MIDYSLHGLTNGNAETYRAAVHTLVGQSVVELLAAQKSLSNNTILVYLINEIEKQPDEYKRKIHRVAIEMIGTSGR